MSADIAKAARQAAHREPLNEDRPRASLEPSRATEREDEQANAQRPPGQNDRDGHDPHYERVRMERELDASKPMSTKRRALSTSSTSPQNMSRWSRVTSDMARERPALPMTSP